MATTTENLDMTLPDTTDPVDVTVLNGNFSALDTFAGAQTEKDTEQDGRLTAIEAKDTEQDAAIEQLSSDVQGKASLADIFGVKPAIPSGTDLDTMQTPGVYACGGASLAATLTNCPTVTDAFVMTVDNIVATSRIIQKLYAVNTSSGVPCIYIRALYSAGWGAWYRFEGVAVS